MSQDNSGKDPSKMGLEKDGKVQVSDSEKVPQQSTVDEGEVNQVNLESDLEKAQKEAKDNYDKYVRAVAEHDNYRKRVLKEKSDYLRYEGERLARDLLEIVDVLELAVSHEKPELQNDQHNKGVKMILDKLVSILEKNEIKSESGLHQTFDPNKQEAIASMVDKDHAPGVVVQEYKKAYFLKDKLLRPGQVVVAKLEDN